MNVAIDPNCVFCTSPDISNVRQIARNDLAFAFPTNIPITPGHTIICPVRHVEKFEELTDDERVAIFELTAKIKSALKKVFGAEGFHHAWNEGKVAGQSVPHFHLHIVPRKQGDEGITEYEPRKFLYRPGSRETTPEAELKDIAEQIRGAIG
jgi:histidine triad (HIT) family protein